MGKTSKPNRSKRMRDNPAAIAKYGKAVVQFPQGRGRDDVERAYRETEPKFQSR